jgi:hypothetical protein
LPFTTACFAIDDPVGDENGQIPRPRCTPFA